MTLKPRTIRTITPYLFMLPGLILFLVFMIYPLFSGVRMSFYQWSIMPNKPSTFLGFDNYIKAFQDPIVGVAFKNTVLYTAVTVPAQMVLAMLAALLLNAVTRGRTLFRIIYYLPVVTSWVIVSLLFRYLFSSPNGLVNFYLVEVFHFVQEPVPWLQQANTSFVPVLGLGIWKGIGWSMIIYLAALATVPKELTEAASIDGATPWNHFWGITLPLISPTVVYTLVMLLIGGFNVFISVYLITNGGPMQQTEVFLSYLYHQTFGYLDFGYGAALSFLLAFLIITASGLQMKFLRRPQELM